MIAVCVTEKKTGEFVSCSASGHAEFAVKGCDIVCAAVTILMRTTMNVLSENNLLAEKNANQRGKLFFRAKANANKVTNGFEKNCETNILQFAKIFLVNGITSLAKEFPKNVSLEIVSEKNS